MKNAIQLFEKQQVRTFWDDREEDWYFSVVDIIGVLTNSINPTDYLKKLRKRDFILGDYIGTNCPQVEMTTSTGKTRKTLAANTKHVFRIVQSIPSKKAEPFKLWLAEVAKKRLDQIQDPELSTKEISEVSEPKIFRDHKQIAKRGGNIAKEARIKLEQETGKKVVSRLNAKKALKRFT